MTVRVDVWSDFVCPWCFLAYTSLEKLKQSHHVEVNWHSYELRPKNSPPMPESYRRKIETELHPRMVTAARQHYGIEIERGPFGIESRMALIGAKYAETQGKGTQYRDAVFRAYWQDAMDISNISVLREIAVATGLNGDDFANAVNDQKYEIEVIGDIVQARNYGLDSVPAMIFANKYLVSGAQPYETLAQITEELQAGEVESGV